MENNYLVNLYKGKNWKLEILSDTDPMNPREWDNLGVMVCTHKRYTLPCEESGFYDGVENWGDARKKLEGLVYLPVFMYDHSGTTISTTPFSCPWDSGQIGFIYIPAEKFKEEYGRKTKKNLEKALRVLKGEIEIYDQYLTGDVYGFTLTTKEEEPVVDEDGNFYGWNYKEEEDSCWGFYGDDIRANGIWDSLPENVRKEIA